MGSWGEGGEASSENENWVLPKNWISLNLVIRLSVYYDTDMLGVKAKYMFLGKTPYSHNAFLLQVYKVYNYMDVSANKYFNV